MEVYKNTKVSKHFIIITVIKIFHKQFILVKAFCEEFISFIKASLTSEEIQYLILFHET